MAITKDKLLPSSKPKVSINIRPKTTKINTSKVLSPVEDKNEDNDNNILNSIGKKVLRIRDIFASTTLFKKKQTEKNRIQKEEETSDKNEKKLENKQKDKDNKFKVPSIPGLGFLGFLKNFIFKTLIGYFVYNLIPHLPKLIGFIKLATPVFNFLLDWGGKALDGLVTFIDWGYKAIDKTEKFIKDIGGDGALKMFKKFEGAFTAFINGALIFGMLATGKGKGPKGTKPTRPNGNSGKGSNLDYFDRNKRIKKIEKTYGNDAARMFENDLKNGKSQKGALNRVRSQFKPLAERFGPQRGLLGGTGEGNIMKRGLSKAPQRAAIKFLGKGPAKFLTKGLGRVPVIGGLIDFAINVAMGEEPIGRAAAKAVGSTAGAALGTLIPVPFAGTILGGYLGDIAGGMLYDSLTGGEKQKAAGGGRITRGGKSTSGPIKRTLKKPRRTLNVKSTPVKPGASIGGKKNISKIFPENSDNKSINPLGYMEKSFKTMSEGSDLAPLFGLPIKAILGQKPDKTDYMNAGNGLSNWISLASSNEITRGGTAFASGGPVTVSPMLGGGDITKWLQNSVENLVVPKIDDIINDLMKEMRLKGAEDIKTTPSSSPSQPGVEGAADFSGSSGEEKTMHYLISQGLTGEQAAGIAGNLQQEGGFDPKADNITHHGIAQWDKQIRWPKVSAYISSKGMDPNTLEGQLVGLKWEAQDRGQWQEIKNAKSLQEASDIWLKKFEIPGDYAIESPRRAAFGNKLFAKYGNYRPPAGSGPVASNLAESAKSLKGMSTASGPDGGNNACVWAVNKVFSKAGLTPPWGNSNNVPDAESAMINSGYVRIASGNQMPGDLYIVNGQKHIGVVLPDGNIISNSSSGAKFSWIAPLSQYQNTYGGSGKFYRIPSNAASRPQAPSSPVASSPPAAPRAKPKPPVPLTTPYTIPRAFQLTPPPKPPTKPQITPLPNIPLSGGKTAFAKGGRVLKPTLATLAENGRPEFVFDADTTRGLDSLAPNLLEYLNAAKTKPQLMSVLQSYAGYENMGMQDIIVELPEPELIPVPVPMNRGTSSFIGGSNSDPYESLALIG